MKKTVSILLFVCFLLTMTFNTSLTTTISADSNISELVISDTFSPSLSASEIQNLNQIVDSKLDIQNFAYQLISSFTALNRYILVEGDNRYLIYDRALLDYVEFSTQNNSVFFMLPQNVGKIYLAPTYYYYFDSNGVKDVVSDQLIVQEDIAFFQQLDTSLKETYFLNKAILQPDVSTNNSEPGIPEYITHDYYFRYLKNNKGSNTENAYSGSCSYVAIEMLLTYYDSVINDNIIHDTYDVTSTKTISHANASSSAPIFNESPGINDSFHGDFIAYGRNQGYTSSNSCLISMADSENLINDYFTLRGVPVTIHNATLTTNKVDFCETAIDSNNPVMISIFGYDAAVRDEILNHRIVGYGYDNNGIIANFGWKLSNYETNINKYLIKDAIYIEINSQHICSNNYIWEYNSCSGTVCPCGIKTCNHALRTTSQHNPLYHRLTCAACNNQLLQEHTFTTFGGMKTCTKCSYSIDASHTHNYVYSYVSMNRHRKTCSCGYSVMEGCVWMSAGPGDPKICARCGHIVEE